VRMPFLRDLTLQTVRQEVATGLGGLTVVLTGATLVANGRLDSGILPLLTLLAMSAFVPVWEIARSAASSPIRWGRRGACTRCTRSRCPSPTARARDSIARRPAPRSRCPA